MNVAPLFHAAGRRARELRLARPIRILSAGNHHPMLCEMDDADGPAGLWVVKPTVVLSRSTDRGTLGVLAELGGAEVCAWAGLRTPAIGLTRFPASLDEDSLRAGLTSLEEPEIEEVVEIFRANRGKLGFCGRHIDDAADLRRAHLVRRKWRATAVPDAVALLVADAYMRHDDRQAENPNALWFDGHVVPIDHGLAFAGLSRAGATGDDLARRTMLHAPNFPTHIAFTAARRYGQEAHWEVATAQLEAVGPKDAEALTGTWPAELDEDAQSGQRELRWRFARFLGERGKYVRELVTELRRDRRRP